MGGIECNPVPLELTYGLERLAMFIQGVENVHDLDWDGVVRIRAAKSMVISSTVQRLSSPHGLEHADTKALFQHFKDAEAECGKLLALETPLALPVMINV